MRMSRKDRQNSGVKTGIQDVSSSLKRPEVAYYLAETTRELADLLGIQLEEVR